MAASLAIGIALGTQWQASERLVGTSGNTLIASGTLAHSLDTQLNSTLGSTRILVSFRSKDAGLCRVFSAPVLDGIACRYGGTWQLRQTRKPSPAKNTDYRQEASGDAVLLAAAQDMMAGEPLDAAAEARARASGWR